MQPRNLKKVINRKLYNTETAVLLAGNDYWDGNNWERSGRNTFLYRTKKGAYFAVHLTCWQGEADHIEPITEGEAVELFEGMREQRVSHEDAFPGVEVEEA